MPRSSDAIAAEFKADGLPKPPAPAVLASNRCASYITGEILPIIGGYGGG
jgi:hypothetical protein